MRVVAAAPDEGEGAKQKTLMYVAGQYAIGQSSMGRGISQTRCSNAVSGSTPATERAGSVTPSRMPDDWVAWYHVPRR